MHLHQRMSAVTSPQHLPVDTRIRPEYFRTSATRSKTVLLDCGFFPLYYSLSMTLDSLACASRRYRRRREHALRSLSSVSIDEVSTSRQRNSRKHGNSLKISLSVIAFNRCHGPRLLVDYVIHPSSHYYTTLFQPSRLLHMQRSKQCSQWLNMPICELLSERKLMYAIVEPIYLRPN